MSTKTLRKRIAVVAVSALTAGLFSVVSAPVANAALIEYAAGTDGSLGLLNGTYCVANSATGATGATQTDSTAADDLRAITMPVGAKFNIAIGDAGDMVTVSPGLVIDVFGVNQIGATVSNGGLTAVAAADEDDINVSSATVGSYTLSSFSTNAGGTAKSVISVSVVASCTSNTWSDSKSSYETSAAEDATPDGEAGSTYTYVDEATAYVSLLGKNAYNANLPVGTWIASATNGALVGMSDGPGASVGSTSVASLTADGSTIHVAVEQATTGVALDTVVTVSYNGKTVYSKSIKFTGDASKISVFGVDVQDAAGALTGIYDVTVQDAAGNYLVWAVSGDATKYNNIVTSVTGGNTAASSAGTLAAATWACNGVSGQSTVRLKATTNAGTSIYSNDFTAACGKAAYTYTASLDKAVYTTGDIATLTITAKDSSGFAPFKNETVDAAAGVPSIAGAQMTAVNTPVATDVFNASGVKTYTFTVGSTPGKYNMAVNLGYTGNSAVAVPYEVKSNSTDVTNADVLKAIVSLIASINKQIAALQKALLKK